jgi:putative ATP/GTP-binding protein
LLKKNKKYGEIYFLIEENSKVIAIEIKSRKDYERHSALNNLLNNDLFNLEKGYVFCNVIYN